MFLSRPAEYGLRAMTYLARMNPGERIRTLDLSAAIDVPSPFLSKIMRKLTAVGILDAKKGHHGGFVMARQPEDVTFMDIMRAVDFNAAEDHCVFGLKQCDGKNPCPLHYEWSSLKGHIEGWARSHTLADVIKD
jgi:Rrf2 family iron-sulfur cluster assembly transcriptional regulator